jgi:hypothetical protein
MGAVIVAVVADIAFVAIVVVLWRLFGARIREFVEHRLPISFFRR